MNKDKKNDWAIDRAKGHNSATPQPPLPPLPLSHQKHAKRRMDHSGFLSLTSVWFELAAIDSQAIEYFC